MGRIDLMTNTSAGYATVTAVLVSLALATVAIAVMGRSLSALKVAQSQLDHVRFEAALDGAATEAAVQIVRSKGAGPYQFSVTDPDGGTVTVLAEPEWQKLGVKQLDTVDDASLAKLGASDPPKLRSAIAAHVGSTPTNPWLVVDAEPAPLWRTCAGHLLSVFGQSSTLPVAASTPPSMGGSNLHLGEVWRLVIQDRLGWTDERFVRFTGDPLHLVAIIDRRLTRQPKGETRCVTIAQKPI